MTSSRRAEVEHAVELAKKYRLRIAGRGVRKADGAPVWAVTSHSRPGVYHISSALVLVVCGSASATSESRSSSE